MTEPLAGPRLMVPTDLTALVVSGDPGADTWADVAPSYADIQAGMFIDLLPAPLATQGPPPAGVHLHWALPDALTHGVQSSAGMTYPLVPNRWLLTRSWWDVTAKKTQLRAWVVQSDALAGAYDKDRQSVAWPVRIEADPPYAANWLGDVMAASDWSGEPKESVEPFLTAIGPGDPTFAACYSNCRGVFAVWDDVSDLPAAASATFTYSVVGWYSDPAKGPLAGCDDAGAWRKQMKALAWAVPEGTTETPTDTLVHGLLHSVAWNGTDAAYRSGVPSGQVDVSFGNSSTEALGALIRSTLTADEDVEAVLDAFQYGVLDALEGQDPPLALAQALHERQFGSAAGGVSWDVRRKPGASDKGDVPPQLPDAVATALAQLNDRQAEVDGAARALESAREKLYALWHRKAELDLSPLGPQPPFDGLEALIEDKPYDLVDGRAAALATATSNRDAARAQVGVALAAAKLADHEAVKLAAPRFWQPSNPVVLLSGAGVERSFRHGADDRFGDLLCRVSGQTVTAATVQGAMVDAGALAPFAASAPAIPGPVPAEVPSLALEAALLAPSLAIALAWAGLAATGVTSPSDQQLSDWTTAAQAVQNAVWNAALRPGLDAPALAAAAGIVGTVPSKAAVSQWSQPWIPLSFQWSVAWFPSSVDPTQPLTGWTLDGPDFVWDSALAPDANPDLGILGAAPINAAAAAGLAAAIDRYLAQHPSDPHAQTLADIASATTNLNVIAQSLSGFNGALCGTKETLQFPVIDNDPRFGADVAKRVANANGVAPADDSPSDGSEQMFFPIRAGHLQFRELRVVDAFSQVQEVIAPNANPNLICSTPMTTAGHPTFAELPPRIAQPSQLSFRLIAANPPQGGRVEANRAPATTPIAAWLLPNRLDASLMVYDAGGEAKGELQLIEGTLNPEGRGVRWVPAPGLPVTYGAAPDLAAHAQQFAEQMIAFSTDGQSALSQLLTAIDEALWQINPLGSWADRSLAQLVGRPLALVRATLSLELFGDPAFDTSWRAVGTLLGGGDFTDFGLTDTSFDVTLGNSQLVEDGLVGYFVDDDYSHFHLAQYGHTPPTGGYVLPVAPVALEPDAAPVTLTLLVDPRAAVHAASGIQPTKAITVPPDQTAAALAAMDVTFMTGPLVTDSQVLAAPTPGGSARGWSWLSHPSPAEWQTVPQIAPASATAKLTASQQRIVDGWMKRSGAFASNVKRRSIRGL